MKNQIKLLSVFISIIMILTISFSAKAETIELKSFSFKNNTFLSVPTYNKNLEKTLTSSWNDYITIINISSYKIKASNIAAIYFYITELYPEYFYLENGINIQYNSQTGIVYNVLQEYLGTTNQIKNQRTQFLTESNKILNNIKSGMSDEDKVVYLHDYIATHNAYDPDGITADVDDVDEYSFNAYGCIVNHVSVCQGMSDAFMYLAKRAGLYARMVSSEQMVHAWNLVQLDNSYYHLDITWDDNASDAGLDFLNVNGFVSHDYFIKSDTQMNSLNHESWETDNRATNSTTYNNYYWDGVYSNIFVIKGYQYYVKNGQLIKRSAKTGETKTIFTFSAGSWTAQNGKTYAFNSKGSVIAFDYKNNYLAFNTADGIYALNLFNNNVSKIVDSPYSGYIAGIAFFDNTLYYDIVNYDIYSKLVKTADVTTTISYPDYNILYGDCDNSGEIASADVLALRKFLAGIDYSGINEFTSDFNNDNAVNAKDLLMVRKFLAQLPIE